MHPDARAAADNEAAQSALGQPASGLSVKELSDLIANSVERGVRRAVAFYLLISALIAIIGFIIAHS